MNNQRPQLTVDHSGWLRLSLLVFRISASSQLSHRISGLPMRQSTLLFFDEQLPDLRIQCASRAWTQVPVGPELPSTTTMRRTWDACPSTTVDVEVAETDSTLGPTVCGSVLRAVHRGSFSKPKSSPVTTAILIRTGRAITTWRGLKWSLGSKRVPACFVDPSLTLSLYPCVYACYLNKKRVKYAYINIHLSCLCAKYYMVQ